jgi:hypothetical protein
MPFDRGLDLGQRLLLGLHDEAEIGVIHRKAAARVSHPRPFELRKVGRLVGIGVGEAEGVARSPMKGVPEVDDLAPQLLLVPLGRVLSAPSSRRPP